MRRRKCSADATTRHALPISERSDAGASAGANRLCGSGHGRGLLTHSRPLQSEMEQNALTFTCKATNNLSTTDEIGATLLFRLSVRDDVAKHASPRSQSTTEQVKLRLTRSRSKHICADSFGGAANKKRKVHIHPRLVIGRCDTHSLVYSCSRGRTAPAMLGRQGR